MSITRRTALRALAAAGATTILPRHIRGADERDRPDGVAVLYDPTRCIGCRRCIEGCAEANGGDPSAALREEPELAPEARTVLCRFPVEAGESFRKVQCMHCLDPACVSACMLGAMHVDADGAVVWNGDLCVGCRYCQIACPFTVPRFEWDTPLPELVKCELCPERRSAGRLPACVERCRRGALVYGTRSELLAEAHRRIDARPERYNPEVYGEDDGGGTSVLYLAESGVSFAEMGLPDLGTESVPSLPEAIQHTLYKGFVAPLALFALFGAVVRRNLKKLHDPEAGGGAEPGSEPVGGRLLTWPTAVLGALTLVGVAVVVWRFVAGLGATTNLSDGYPMGLWIAFDVVTGTALACGGYAVALLVYLANRGKYHPLVRAALVTSALGYTLGGLSVLIDIGRAWNFYKIPLFFTEWNVNSILLEVALCIMLYTCVLWIEVSPAFLERWRGSRVGTLRRLAVALSPRLERAMPYLIALGLLLPTMHQSSLGSLMLMAGRKLHPLWHTPLLPLLFLVSSVAMGYAAVTLESSISARVFRRPRETGMLRALAGPVAWVLLVYAALRVGDLALGGRLALVAEMDFHALLFLAETALFVVPALALLTWRNRAGAGFLSSAAVAVVAGGTLYRFSTYLIAFDPGPEWSYFPALSEFAVSVGLVSAEILGYVILVKTFPILRGADPRNAEADSRSSGRETDRSEDRRPEASRAPAAAAVLLSLGAVGVAALGSPVPARAQDTAGLGDLRCLTDRPEQCLDEPVPLDEPHGAVCATCHDLWSQESLADAVTTCTSSGCHDGPDTLSAFHRGLHDSLIEDCVACHDPHDARIPDGSRDCTYCHRAGGEPARLPGSGDSLPDAGGRADPPRRIVPPPVAFRHSTHGELTCTRCHASGERHEEFEVTRLEDCRACHHTGATASDCLACHAPDDARDVVRQVTRRLAMEVGALDRPRRILPFDHGRHADTPCRTCHTEGLALRATETDCTACHEEHHRPEADCAACHAVPAEGAHDRQAHLGCGGSGCHVSAPESILAVPRTRSLCLSCHRDLRHHKPGKECAACHVLPPPRPPQTRPGRVGSSSS